MSDTITAPGRAARAGGKAMRVSTALVVACILTASSDATAAERSAVDAFPTRPIRFIVPVPPGGGADFVARGYAARLTEAFGQQVVVDNRGGAAGIIAMDAVAKA